MILLVEQSTIKLLFLYVTKAKKNFEDHQNHKAREPPPISFFFCQLCLKSIIIPSNEVQISVSLCNAMASQTFTTLALLIYLKSL